MELRHLRYFTALAEVLHFGQAAARLGIAQPSLSHQIFQLEAELQTSLFERTKRRVRLTGPGRVFLEEARTILARADRASVLARRAGLGEIGRIRIGFAPWVDPTKIISIVKRLHERQRAIRVELQSLSVPLQIAALREERLDVAFIRQPVTEPSLASELLMAESFVAALPGNHGLARNQRISLAALSDEPHILFSREALPTLHDLTLKLCRDAGFVPHVRYEADHPQMVLGLVAAGLGVSLVPASSRRLKRSGLVFRSLRPSPRVLETAVAWRRDHGSPIVEEFLEVFREVAASVAV